MMRLKKILVVIASWFAIFFPGNGNAQQAWTIYNAVNSPLPENSVRCITIAPDGKKWIGTDYGLASFDDVNWTVYYTNNSGLPDNSIRSLAADSSGNIWIGTFSSGLVKFDGTTWTNYTTFNSDIPDDFVRSIAIDTLGNKWVGTIGGLAYFDDVSWEIYDMSNTGILSNNMSSMYLDVSDNSLTVGTINGGMAIFNGSTWTYFNIWNTNLPDNSILGITKDTSGTLWLATPASGLSAYIGGFAFLTLTTVSSAIQSNSLTALSSNRNNDDIWIASNDAGVIRKSGLNFDSFNTNNSPMPDNFVQTVKVDSAGIVWIGTQMGGLVRLDESFLSSTGSELFSEALQFFPVPANEMLTIRFGEKLPIRTEVYDLKGRLCVAETGSINGQQQNLNVSELTAGMYMLKVSYSDGRYSCSKFLIAR